MNALSQHAIRRLIQQHSPSRAFLVNRAIYVRGGFLALAKPSHMRRRSGGEPCESASFFARLSTRACPRIFFNGFPLPACAAQDELVSIIFVDHPLDQHAGAEFTIFLICDYHIAPEKLLHSTASSSALT